ncbi:hypothetical protein [uncultured Tenacibaculum sp.]|uniref:hypothetical protein n=1 Tax=uncultured Tenacibaculum sp. TaxID=174713 RepID=UPI00262F76E5|nr:hypothetical protein [uncultured Tenacibaculum sp.]
MKLLLKQNLIAVLILSAIIFTSCKKKEETLNKVKEKVAYNKKVTESLCMSDWFPHIQTPAPEEGKGSPFDVPSTTNAIFHQWSWQKFLWLTKPTVEVELIPIITRGEPTPIIITRKLPLFLNPEKMHQVTSHLESVPLTKGVAVVLTDTKQAGPGAILKTNPAYNKKNNKAETVYYSIHVSPIFKEAATKFKDSILNGTLSKNNLSSFPVGSLELKVSWVAKSAIPENELDNYYTTVAAISENGTDYVNTEVALLGMHVVGVVENHPEFIWATFEHSDMAPNYDRGEDKASSLTEKLLFEKGETSGITGITWDSKTQQPVLKSKAFDLFEYGVPRDSTGGFMKNTSQEEPINFNNIRDINACVKKNLEKEEGPWKNYFYNGSIWIDTDGFSSEQQAQILVGLRGEVANAYPGGFARGSLNCANVTMETFTQTFKDELSEVNVGNLANCFSCHNAVSYTNNSSPIYMSHIFDAYIKRAEGKTFDEVEAMKAKQEVEEFIRFQLE